MSSITSQRKWERLSEMHLLIRNPSYHKCSQSLLMTVGLHAPFVIWYSNRCPLSLLLLRTCSSKTISMINLYTVLGTLVLYIIRGFKSIRGLLWASSIRDSSTSSPFLWIGCQQWLQYMASTPEVIIHWARSISDAILKTWNQKWCVVLSMLTHPTTFYLNHGSTPIG